MLATRWKLGLLGIAMAASLVAAGCLRSTQIYTIYPDGSGKAEVRMTLMGMLAQQAKMGGQSGKSPLDQVKESVKGKVYWQDLKAEDKPDGTYVLSGTAFFENIADIEPDKGSLTFAPEGDGHTLTLIQEGEMPPGLGGDGDGAMTPEEKAQAEQMKGMIKGMLAGFEMKVGVRMPGEVTEIAGFGEQSGREAYLTIGEQDIIRMIDKNERPPETLTATSGAPSEELKAEWEAFKLELAAAKAAAPAPGGEDEGEPTPEPQDEGQF